MNITKTNSSYKYGCYHVGRTDIWGNYCPDTGEYYLACNDTDPIAGEYIHTLASCSLEYGEGYFGGEGRFHEYYEDEYTYEVVRELLQLGHLTKNTLAAFVDAGGEVWWDQP